MVPELAGTSKRVMNMKVAMQRVGRRVVCGVAGVAAVASLAVAAAPEAMASTGVGGSVSCVTGRAVEGIWVVANSGGSNWARMNVAGGTSSAVSWSYTLPNGGSYSLHVGCGGSPSSWASTSTSGNYSGGSGGMLCYDLRYEVPSNLQYRCTT